MLVFQKKLGKKRIREKKHVHDNLIIFKVDIRFQHKHKQTKGPKNSLHFVANIDQIQQENTIRKKVIHGADK